METSFGQYLDPSLLNVLPNETLLNICNQMDDLTLSRFVQTYGKAYQICNEILELRKAEYILLQYQNIAQEIIAGSSIVYTKTPSVVTFSYRNGQISISHVPISEPWPIPGINFTTRSRIHRATIPLAVNLAVDLLARIIKSLEEQGYTRYSR